MFEALLFVFIGLAYVFVGCGLLYAIGICTRCGKWSMKYTCPGCNHGRYDYWSE